MGKAIFGKLNLFSKNIVNNLENIMNSVFTISEKKKKGGGLQSVLWVLLHYLHYFNVCCEFDKITHNLPKTYLTFNNSMKGSKEIYMTVFSRIFLDSFFSCGLPVGKIK